MSGLNQTFFICPNCRDAARRELQVNFEVLVQVE